MQYIHFHSHSLEQNAPHGAHAAYYVKNPALHATQLELELWIQQFLIGAPFKHDPFPAKNVPTGHPPLHDVLVLEHGVTAPPNYGMLNPTAANVHAVVLEQVKHPVGHNIHEFVTRE